MDADQERVIKTETLLEAHLASCSEESRAVRERMDKLADDIKTDVREIHRRLSAASRMGVTIMLSFIGTLLYLLYQHVAG